MSIQKIKVTKRNKVCFLVSTLLVLSGFLLESGLALLLGSGLLIFALADFLADNVSIKTN